MLLQSTLTSLHKKYLNDIIKIMDGLKKMRTRLGIDS